MAIVVEGGQWTEEELAALRRTYENSPPGLLEFNRIKGPTMSPPRRPKGEKPRTTIRFLQRQIANLQTRISAYYDDIQQKNKQIAAQDVELSEASDRERILTEQVEDAAGYHGRLLATHQYQKLRLQFLEGYYHAKTEALPGSRSGHQGAHSDGAATGEESRPETTAGRHGAAIGGQISGFAPNHRASDNRRPTPRETDPDFFEVDGSHGPRATRR